MATSKKITELPAITSAAANDVLYIVHDPAGVPTSNKIKVSDLAKSVDVAVLASVNGNIVPVTDNVFSLGNSTNQWSELHTSAVWSGQANSSGGPNLTFNTYNGTYWNQMVFANDGSLTMPNSYLTIAQGMGPIIVSNSSLVIYSYYMDPQSNAEYYHGSQTYPSNYQIFAQSYDPSNNQSKSVTLALDCEGNAIQVSSDLYLSSNARIRQPDQYTTTIKPSSSFNNELAIFPTADYDIHLFESNTGGAITLGNYGSSFVRVYGPGGSNGGGGANAQEISLQTVGSANIYFETSAGDYRWTMSSDGDLYLPANKSLYVNSVPITVDSGGSLRVNNVAIATTTRANSAVTSASPLDWNSDGYIQYSLTALDTSITINADSGTPIEGRKMVFRFTPSTSGITLTWTGGVSKGFREVGATLPTSLTDGKTTYVGCIYNAAADRWDAVASVTEA